MKHYFKLFIVLTRQEGLFLLPLVLSDIQNEVKFHSVFETASCIGQRGLCMFVMDWVFVNEGSEMHIKLLKLLLFTPLLSRLAVCPGP